MRIFNRVVAWIYSLASLYIAMLFILVWLDSEFKLRFTAFIAETEPYRFALTGAALLLIGAAWLVLTIEHHYRTRSASFNGPGGQVRVQLSAIEDFLTNEIRRQISAVKRIRTTTLNTPKGLQVYNQVIIWSSADIPTTIGKIQDLIKHLLQDTIGVERVGEIKVLVHHIATAEEPETAVPRAEEGTIEDI